MKKNLKSCVALILSLIFILSLSACSSEYPSKNISVIVPYSAGGNTDMSVRALLDVASSDLPKSVSYVVENKTGNGGLVGIEALADSDKDGYHIGTINIDFLLHIALGDTDLTVDDFIPLVATMADPYALVISSSNPNYSNMEEFIAYAKANPGVVKIGHAGAGGAPHVAALAVAQKLGLEFTYFGYEGSADCITAIASGEIDATFTQPTPAASQVQSGALSMICVLDTQPLVAFPDVPTYESVCGEAFAMKGFVALAAPAGMAEDQVTYLRDSLTKALGTSDYQAAIENLGMQYVQIAGDELTQMIANDSALYSELCKGIELN